MGAGMILRIACLGLIWYCAIVSYCENESSCMVDRNYLEMHSSSELLFSYGSPGDVPELPTHYIPGLALQSKVPSCLLVHFPCRDVCISTALSLQVFLMLVHEYVYVTEIHIFWPSLTEQRKVMWNAAQFFVERKKMGATRGSHLKSNVYLNPSLDANYHVSFKVKQYLKFI